MSKSGRLLVIAGLLQVVWGFVPGASKFVIDEIPVELYISLRWSISGAIFAAYLAFRGGWQKIGTADCLLVALLGILGYGLASFGTLYGLKIGGVTNFALMSALGPLMTSAMAVLVLRERPSRLFYLALPMSIFGLALLAFGKYEASSFSIAGASVALILGASLLEALVFVYSKKSRGKMSSVQYLAIAQVAAALFMWLLQIGFFRQAQALQRLTPMGVSATFVGVLIFHEPLRPLMAIGGCFILMGLVVGNWPRGANRPS